MLKKQFVFTNNFDCAENSGFDAILCGMVLKKLAKHFPKQGKET
jgi:hypothetical protein